MLARIFKNPSLKENQPSKQNLNDDSIHHKPVLDGHSRLLDLKWALLHHNSNCKIIQHFLLIGYQVLDHKQ